MVKYPEKISNKFVIFLLFLSGFSLSPLVTGAIFYPQPYSSPIPGGFTIPLLIIPSLIATSIYIRVAKPNGKVKVVSLFIWVILATSIGMLFAMPFGWHLPKPVVELEINRATMIANCLIDYLKNVLVPTILCALYAKLRHNPISVFLLFLIPLALGFLYRFTAILTGGVI